MQQQSENRLTLTAFLGMLAAMAPLSTDMYLPALPTMERSFGVGISLIQLTLTMTMLGMAVGQIVAGPLSDRLGRRRPLVVGMGLFTVASLGCVLASDIYIFLALRLLAGLAGAVGIVLAKAIARDVASGAELTRFIALLMMVNGLAPILAPVVGGQVLAFTSWRGIFVLLAVVGAALTIASWRFKETLPPGSRAASMSGSFKSFGSLLGDAYFRGHCLVQCFAFAGFFAYISGASFVFQNIYQVTPQTFGLIFGGIGVCILFVGAIPARMAGRIADTRLLRWSLAQSLVGALLILACAVLHAPLWAFLLALVVTIPMISMLSAASFAMGMRAHGMEAGSASALIGFFQMAAGGFMAPLVGMGGNANAMPMALIMVIGYALALVSFYLWIAPAHR